MPSIRDHVSGYAPVPACLRQDGILALPDELLSCIFGFLDSGPAGRLQSLLPASCVCRRFRGAAVSRLFATLSCAIRDQDCERLRFSFEKLLGHPNLLAHVGTLSVRVPLGGVKDQESGAPQRRADRWSQPPADPTVIKRAFLSMPRLHTIRQVFIPT